MTQQTINTMQDILDALDQNPELQHAFHKHLVDVVRHDDVLRQEMRKEILTEELLQIPIRFAQFEQAVGARFDRLESDVAELKTGQRQLESDVAELKTGQRRLESDVAELKTGQRQLEGDVAELKTGQRRLEGDVAELKTGQRQLEGDVAELKTGQRRLEGDVAELKTGQRRLEGDVAELKTGQRQLESDVAELKTGQRQLESDVAELKTGQRQLERDVGELKGDAALRATRVVTYDIADDMGHRIVRDLPRAEVRAMSREQALPDMPRNSRRSFAVADAIIEVTTRDGSIGYITVEASYTADERDTFRAIRNAHYIRRMTGQPTWAAVSALRVDDRIQHLIDCGAVHWHRLEPEDFATD